VPLAGDRKFGEDEAIVEASAASAASVCVLGHEKGSTTEDRPSTISHGAPRLPQAVRS
jgi:acetyl-CoA carboxylase alpha subunit